MEVFAVTRNGKICLALVSAKVDLDSQDCSEALHAVRTNCPEEICIHQDLRRPPVAAKLVSDVAGGNYEPQYVLYFGSFALICWDARIAGDRLSISSADILIKSRDSEKRWTFVGDGSFDLELKMSEPGISSIRRVFSRWDECFEYAMPTPGEESLSIRKSNEASVKPCLATLNIGDPIDAVRGGGLLDVESEDLQFITKYWFSPFLIIDGRIVRKGWPVFTVD